MKKIVFMWLILTACCQLTAQTPELEKDKRKNNFYSLVKDLSLNERQKDDVFKIFETLCRESPEFGLKKNFRIAFSRYITDSDRMYELFKDEIDANVESRRTEVLDEYKTKYNLTETWDKIILKHIDERLKITQLGYYLYPEDTQVRIANEKMIKDKYNRRILIDLTIRGVKTNLSNYCTILSYQKVLELDKEQLHTLVLAAWNFYETSKKDKNFQLRHEEHLKIKETLTDEQYEKYLAYKVADKARKQADHMWKRADRMELIAEVDSAKVYPQLYSYFLEQSKINERYSIINNSDDEKEEQLNILKEMRPAMLKKIINEKGRRSKTQAQDNNSLMW